MSDAARQGPLAGVRVLEVAGLGAAPFGCMLLADMGAEVIRVESPSAPGVIHGRHDPLMRRRRRIAIDLKQAAGLDLLLRLADRSDVLVEGFRAGVAERLGFGPQVCQARNARLIYARLTGWGQDGPLAQVAGHDLNYLALSGVLSQIGPRGAKPVPPLNVVGDFGGGALFMAFGVACALYERERSGAGQVIDAAMIDGAAAFTGMCRGLQARGLWRDELGANLLSGAAPHYDTYETSDGKFVALAPLEPQFYQILVDALGLEGERFLAAGGYAAQRDPRLVEEVWPALKAEIAEVIRTRTREHWCALLEGSDACFAPVLSLAEAPEHPHNRARSTYIALEGVAQAAPAPRFSRTPGAHPVPPRSSGADTDALLGELGCAPQAIASLRAQRVVA